MLSNNLSLSFVDDFAHFLERFNLKIRIITFITFGCQKSSNTLYLIENQMHPMYENATS